MPESTSTNAADNMPESAIVTPDQAAEATEATEASDDTVTSPPLAGPKAPRLLGMSRWLAVTVLAAVLAMVLVIAYIFVSNGIQDYNESREKAFAAYEEAFGEYETSVGALDSAVSSAEMELLTTNENQLSGITIRDYLQASTAEAEEVLNAEGALSKVDFESLSNEEIEAEVATLKKSKLTVDDSQSDLSKASRSLTRDKEAKRKADEEARLAAELAAKKSGAVPVAYEVLFRAGDSVLGTYYRFEGKIIQDAGSGTYRVNITKEPGYSMVFWEDTILVNVTGATPQRLLEDDIVSFVAFSVGIQSYQTIFGATVELPAVFAEGSDISVTGRDS